MYTISSWTILHVTAPISDLSWSAPYFFAMTCQQNPCAYLYDSWLTRWTVMKATFFTRTCSKEHSHSVFYQHFTSNVWKNPPSLDNSHLKKSIFPSKKPHLPPDLPPYLPPLTDVSARPWRIRSPAPPRWRSPAPAPRRVMEKPGSYVGFFLAMDCSWLTWLTYVNLWKFDAEWILMVLNSGWWWLT